VDHVAFLGFSQNGIEMALAGGASAGLVVRKLNLPSGCCRSKAHLGNHCRILGKRVHQRDRDGHRCGSWLRRRQKLRTREKYTSFGALAEGGSIDITDSLLTGNGTAVQSQAGSTVRIANSDIYNNLAGFGCGAGTLASAGNNRKGGNTGSGGPVCAPNATINLQ